jgi:hypothetical protein
VQELIDKYEGDGETLSPERVAELRAFEALELMGTPDAKQVLEEIAKGAPGAWRTIEAKAVLTRLRVRAN